MAERGSGIGRDPFAVPEELRDPVRRFRGRMPLPVTIWTANGPGDSLAGITVSSLLIAEGDPPAALGLVGDLTDFWEAARHSRRLVVHLLGEENMQLAERFALRDPGDPFEQTEFSRSDYGPLLAGSENRLMCTVQGHLSAGFGILIHSTVESVSLTDNSLAPLVYSRGEYRKLAP